MEVEVINTMIEKTGLPRNWKVLPIEECLEPLNGKKRISQGWSPQCEKEASPSDEQWGVLKTTAIQAGKYLEDENKLLPLNLDARPQIEVKAGDLLTTCAGPRARCGVTCLVRETRPRLMISGKMYRYRAKDGFVDAEYLEAYLQTQAAWDAIDKMKTGGSDSGLNLTHDRFLKLPIPVAPILEQRRIVAAIELQLGRLDAAVARLQGAKAQLKRYKQAVLKAAVEGRLTHPDMAEDELPPGWRVVQVEDVGQIVTGSTPSKSVAHYYGDEHPFYKPNDLEAGYETIESTDGLTVAGLAEARALPAKSILVTCIGATIGKTGFIRTSGACNQQINAIVPNESLVPEYGYFHCISPYFQKQIKDNASATTLPLLNKSRFKVLDFILPPKADQLLIIREVESKLAAIDETESTLDAQLKQTVRLRQAVMKRAFEGRLV